ncbi:MAG: cob(I)yrinic acid a,c-diamide adenosyltransferase [Acidobacteria bacterium]|nr:cob(I)yrinic acid a,c-diamide adenosyltransferase [Acidobacteriota bacterium]
MIKEEKGKSAVWRKGYVQVYTGNGKGKTTAAFGLALRAAGAGLPVFIAQFAKGGDYSEIRAFRRFEGLITLKQYGSGSFIHGKPAEGDIRAAQKALSEIREVFVAGRYKVVILDEVNIATFFDLISVDDLVALIEGKPGDVELVITGRNADPRVLEKADLVTDMREVKHYYTAGVPARDGIER